MEGVIRVTNRMRKCRICGQYAMSYPTHRASNGYPLLCCSYCATVLVERPIATEELTQLYNDLFKESQGYAYHRAEFEMIKAGHTPPNFYRKRLLKRIERMCETRTLVEIGPGTGSFGILAVSRGWRYIGYDISDVAASFARDLNLDVYVFKVGTIPSLQPESADAIVMWEVIEHIWDVQEYFVTIRNALRPGGVFLFSTPNYMRQQYQEDLDRGFSSSPPVHLNFFSEESLEKSLNVCGFKSVEIINRRIYRPGWTIRSFIDCIKIMLFLDQPMTLYGIARKESE